MQRKAVMLPKPVGILEYPDPHIMSGNKDMSDMEMQVLSTASPAQKIQRYELQLRSKKKFCT